jgi:hypothetical protein
VKAQYMTRPKQMVDPFDTPTSPRKKSRVNDSGHLLKQAYQQAYNVVLSYKRADGHPISSLFMELPSRKAYPDYYNIIQQPIDLTTIQKKIEANGYANWADFQADFELLVNNAKTYNEPDSDIYLDAVEIQRVFKDAYHHQKDEELPLSSEGSREILKEFEFEGQIYRIGDFVRIRVPGEDKSSINPPSIVMIDQLWKTKYGRKEIRGTYFYHMYQTFHPAGRKFMEKEVFRTNRSEEIAAELILGRCYVMFVKDYVRGRPIHADEADVYVCESRYNEKQKQFIKIKDWDAMMPKDYSNRKSSMVWFDRPIIPKKVGSIFAPDIEDSKNVSPFDSEEEREKEEEKEREKEKEKEKEREREREKREEEKKESKDEGKKYEKVISDEKESSTNESPTMTHQVVDYRCLFPSCAKL